MNDVEIIQLIKTTLTRKGTGAEGDPIRIITQYWTMKGEFLFEFDSYKGTMSYNDGELLR